MPCFGPFHGFTRLFLKTLEVLSAPRRPSLDPPFFFSAPPIFCPFFFTPLESVHIPVPSPPFFPHPLFQPPYPTPLFAASFCSLFVLNFYVDILCPPPQHLPTRFLRTFCFLCASHPLLIARSPRPTSLWCTSIFLSIYLPSSHFDPFHGPAHLECTVFTALDPPQTGPISLFWPQFGFSLFFSYFCTNPVRITTSPLFVKSIVLVSHIIYFFVFILTITSGYRYYFFFVSFSFYPT